MTEGQFLNEPTSSETEEEEQINVKNKKMSVA
jgi:hypothetical protein